VQVAVRLFGNLGHYLPEGGNRFSFMKSLDDGTTVQKMLSRLSLPKELPVIVIVNGRRVEAECVLKDGDEVNVLRPSGGG
jgi:sulfur carrier protein ThiS